MDLDKSSCVADIDWCWNFQAKATPAGWYPGKKLYYQWQKVVNGDVVDNATDQCDPYTDGNTCVRHSPAWDYRRPKGASNQTVCVVVKAYQLVKSGEVSDKDAACFDTEVGSS